jgi:hypothetical protein
VLGARVLLRVQPRRGRRPAGGSVRGEPALLRAADGGEDDAAVAQLDIKRRGVQSDNTFCLF